MPNSSEKGHQQHQNKSSSAPSRATETKEAPSGSSSSSSLPPSHPPLLLQPLKPLATKNKEQAPTRSTMLDVFANLASASSHNSHYPKESSHHQPHTSAACSSFVQDVLEMEATEEELRQAADAQSGDSFSASDDYEDEEGGEKRSSAQGSAAGGPKRVGFIETLYNMVHSPENAPAIGFAADGIALEIRNTSFFSNNVLPRYFKHRNVSSFIRQLNNYQFRTIPSSKGIFQTFVHDSFLQNRKELIKQIKRRTGIVVKKKKTLFEQVTELKQREQDYKHRVDELEMNDMQKSLYMNELEAHLRAVKEERDALVTENQRLMIMLSAKDFQMYGGGGRAHPQVTSQQQQQVQQRHPPPPPHYHLEQQQQQQAAWMGQTTQPPSSMFEPVSGPSRFDSGGVLPQQQQQQQMHHAQQQMFDASYDWLQRPPNSG